ncbi:1-deoxy-D-xylulose-5-phosphate reductoisomerase [SAR86 cluster bacterium]|nr:1-deoxy-D-xylulose-5-phosphate reductoisomerase [SAR86 cluster bacterium]
MKKVLILGSTGSIGKSTIEVIEANKKDFLITGLVARSNENLLLQQAKKFNVKNICLTESKKLQEKYISEADLEDLISSDQVDIVVAAISGVAGLKNILSAVRAGKKVLIANKEPLVAAGQILMKEAKRFNAEIIPIDSEHCAIHQCLSNIEKKDLKRIIITCSGGPFLGKSLKNLKNVSVKDALNHPVWKMGSKNLIDSASLMNKALEIIEAKWLFNLESEQIDVIIHPQGIIHSMVETIDNSILAVMSEPDMKICIAYGLGYPNKIDTSSSPLNFTENNSLEFINIDQMDFPSVNFARDALSLGGIFPAVMNAANEVAVEKFVNNEIKFDLIFDTIKHAMDEFKKEELLNKPSLEQIITADEKARLISLNFIRNIS